MNKIIMKVSFKHNRLYEFMALSFARAGLKKASVYFLEKWTKSIKVQKRGVRFE